MGNTLRVPLIYVFFIGFVSADTVTISTGTYDPFPSLAALNNPVTGQNGSLAFWANHSVDGLTNPANVNSPLRPNSQLNIGNFLTGTCGPNAATVGSCPAGTFDGQATPNLSPSSLGYYADGSLPVSSFYFTRDGSSDVLSPDLIYTANFVSLGWYVAGDPSDQTSIFSNLNENSSLPAGFNLDNIPLGTNYGFYVVVNYGSGYLATYYTQSQYNTFTQPQGAMAFASLLGSDMVDGANKQHFGIFTDGTGNGIIALEDGVGNSGYEGMGDYQDAVFGTSLTEIALLTPEPATMFLSGFAIAGVLLGRRRFRCAK